MSITWDDVIIDQKVQTKRYSEPIVSVYSNRLTFNAAVCELIEGIYQYEWVNLKQGIENNHIIKIGLEFSHEKKPNSLHILQKVFRGNKVDGLNLYSKTLIRRFFPEVNNEVHKYLVEKVNPTTIAINLHKKI